MIKMKTSLPTLFRIAALTIAAGCSSATADDWKWSATPYAWLIGTEFSTDVDIPEDGEQAASDIFSKLDFAAQLHVEGGNERFGILFDFTNLQLSDRTDQGEFQLKSDSSTTLLEAALVYNIPFGRNSRASILAGVRALDVDLELEFIPLEGGDAFHDIDYSETLTDFMFGLRYVHAISDTWDIYARVDAASGDTDFSTNLVINLARDVGSTGQIVVGYRYLEVEFKRGDALLDPRLKAFGPQIGYSFRF